MGTAFIIENTINFVLILIGACGLYQGNQFLKKWKQDNDNDPDASA